VPSVSAASLATTASRVPSRVAAVSKPVAQGVAGSLNHHVATPPTV
jgi:hypothetical protein